MAIKSIFIVSVVSLALIACGGGKNPDIDATNAIPENQKVGSQKAEILSGADTLIFNGGVLQGTGSVRFAEPLSKAESAHNYTLKFTLAESSSLTLVANSNRVLASGVEVEIARPQGSTALTVAARAGSDTLDLSSFFSAIDASGEVSLSFDIHNDHGASVHLISWNQVTSEELFEDMLQGRGFGANWGLKLNGAVVNSIGKSGPRDEH